MPSPPWERREKREGDEREERGGNKDFNAFNTTLVLTSKLG
jgi:hypothetical protein